MSMVRMAVAAMGGALGAPSVVAFDDNTSEAYSENTAGVIFHSDGSLSIYYVGVPNVIGYWLTPQTNMSDYEIRATLNSGDTPTGTLSTWEALTTDRQWTLQTSTPLDVVTCNLTIEIRWTGNNVVQDSATFIITANQAAEP
jgi:hypothetical protein